MPYLRASRVTALLAAMLVLGSTGDWTPAAAVSSLPEWTAAAPADGSPLDPRIGAGTAAPDVTAEPEITGSLATTLTEPLAPGVSRRRGTVATGTGTQVVQLIDVDPSTPGIRLESLRPGGGVHAVQTVRDQAARVSTDGHRVVAAVNGDVFSTDDATGNHGPIGLVVRNGQLVSGSRATHPTLGVDASGAVRLGDTTVAASVLLPSGTRLPINRVNKPRMDGQLIVYSRQWGTSTRSTAGGVEVVLAGPSLVLRPTATLTATVASVGKRRDTPIASGSLVLSATGPRAATLAGLRAGQTVEIRTIVTPGWEGIREAIGGREWVVRDGATAISPVSAVTTAAHPRTAIGLRADGSLVIAVVDGREYGYSIGMTASEMATLLESEGAVEGVLLDGGGSSTALARRPGDRESSLLNKPSDGRERPVSSSLAVVSTIPTGPLAALVVRPAGATALVGESVPLVAKGVDAALNAVTSFSPVTWSVDGPAGTVTTSGLFRAQSPGGAVVTATTASLSSDATLTVVPDTVAPVPAQPSVRIARGATVAPDAVPVTVSWTATDQGTGVASYDLRRRLDGIAWQDVGLPSAKTTSIATSLPLTRAIQYQVRATDQASNTSAWRSASAFHVRLHGERAPGTTYKGTWFTSSSAAYLGGAARWSRQAGATASWTFTGSQVAWVAKRGPAMGSARISIDGTAVATVSLYSATTQARRIVFTRTFSSAGTHRLTIRVLGTHGHPRINVDGFAVVDSASPYPVLVGAGDVASCSLTSDTATGRVIGRIPGTVFAAGDLAYETGSAAGFTNCYTPAWGGFKSRTRPVPGNHEYGTAGAAPYFAYFGASAGTPGEGWYAYDLGTWRIYSLNANCTAIGGCGAGSPQETWLRADLAAHPSACVAAVWHQPLFSSGMHGNDPSTRALWKALQDAGAELVLNGHDHEYERFAPQLADGMASAAGIREFVVGTGGASLRAFSTVRANSVVRKAGVYGVLRLELKPGAYAWRFFPVAGKTWTDSGSASCH